MKKIFKNPFLLPLLVIVFAFTLFTAASCEDANKETLSPYKAKEKVQFNDSTFFTEIGVIDKWSTATTKVYIIKYDGCKENTQEVNTSIEQGNNLMHIIKGDPTTSLLSFFSFLSFGG